MFTPGDVLDFAVQLEKNGEAIYRRARNETPVPELQQLLEWAAGEEREHATWFARIKADIAVDGDHHLIADMNEALVSEYFGNQSFSLREVDFAGIGTTEQMIGVFVEFQEDTILFYQMLESFITDGETVDRLKQIIQEEQNHIVKLKAFL